MRAYLAVLAFAAVAMPTARADQIVVRPGDSLQAAVDAASPGDTLRVRGTHAGQVVIDHKSLRLVGEAGARLTPGPDVGAYRMFTVSLSEIDFGPFPQPFGGILTAVDCDVTLDGITVDGMSTLVDGIVFVRAGGTVKHCDIRNLCLPEFPHLAQFSGGTCILSAHDGDVPRALDVLDCRLTRWNANGLMALGGPNREPGPTRLLLRVEDCVVIGAGENADAWQYGLYSSTGVIPQYRRNVVKDLVYTDQPDYAHPGTAIWSFFPFADAAHPCVVKDNVIENVQQGIILWGLDAPVTVSGNRVRTSAQRARDWWLAAIYVNSWGGDVRVADNDATAGGADGFALALDAESQAGDVVVADNRGRVSGAGAAVLNGIFAWAGSGALKVQGNRITLDGALTTAGMPSDTGTFGMFISGDGAQVLDNRVEMLAQTSGVQFRDQIPSAIAVFERGARVSGNDVRGAGQGGSTSGVQIYDAPGSKVLDNRIADLPVGVVVFNSADTRVRDNRTVHVGRPEVAEKAALVTELLVPSRPLDLVDGLGYETIPDARPEDYLAVDGAAPAAWNVREGAAVGAGSGLVTTGVRAGPGGSQLVRYALDDPSRPAWDPALFEGDAFYDARVYEHDLDPDDPGAMPEVALYSSTLFFFLENRTGAEVTAYIGFASDDSATLFVEGRRVDQFVGGRGYGLPGAIENLPVAVALHPGANLVQLSYTDGFGGSGARIGVFASADRTRLFDRAVLEATVSPD